jgi:hypothetical protein
MKKKDYGVSELEDDDADFGDSGVPFQVMMQRAATLRSKQGEVFRRRYDSWPLWYQHSMFSKEDVIEARKFTYKGPYIAINELMYLMACCREIRLRHVMQK